MQKKVLPSNELKHHGIKGQKWGIRRYQNPDGTLTAEGRERYLRIIKGAPIVDSRAKLPDTVLRESDGYIIRKGTNVYRVAAKKEPIDSNRKYVSVTEEDRERYDEWAATGELGIKYKSSPLREYTYESIDDIKVASGHEVAKYLIEKIGDHKITNDYNYINDAFTLPDVDLDWFKKNSSDHDLAFIEDFSKYFMKARNDVRRAFNNELFKSKSQDNYVIEEFEKRGYDAMVDVEDWFGGLADLPIVLFNPKSKIKTVEEKKISWSKNVNK